MWTSGSAFRGHTSVLKWQITVNEWYLCSGCMSGKQKKKPNKKIPSLPPSPSPSKHHSFHSICLSILPFILHFLLLHCGSSAFLPTFSACILLSHCLLFSLLFIWAFRGWISFSQWYLTALTTTSRVHHSGRTEQRCLNAFLEHCWGAVGDGHEDTEPPPTSYKIFIYFSLFEHRHLFITLY